MSRDARPSDGPVRVVVAPLRVTDLRAVVRIEEAVFAEEPWSRRLFEEELAQRTSRVYRAAWVGRRLVGYAGLMLVDDEAHVNTLAVSPDDQGRGLGSALLADLVHTALDRRARHLTLEVRVGNEAALGLYSRFGLAPVGVRRDYYGHGADALVMWARDIDGPEYAVRLGGLESDLAPALEIERRD